MRSRKTWIGGQLPVRISKGVWLMLTRDNWVIYITYGDVVCVPRHTVGPTSLNAHPIP